MAFDIDVDVSEVLKSLRDAGFDWIATEIQSQIEEGKGEEIEYHERGARKSKTGTTTVPYVAPEQEQILFRTLQSYFVEIHDVWSSATQRLTQSLRLDAITISHEQLGTEPVAEPLSSEFVAIRLQLASLLKQGLQEISVEEQG